MKEKPMKNNLKTTEEIKEALSKVADMMEQEVFTHKGDGYNLEDQSVSKYNYSQNVTADGDYDCGTVACIGGWCWLLTKEKPIKETDTKIKYRKDAIRRADHFVESDYHPDRPEGLHELFYPSFEEIDGLEHLTFGHVTPKQAAKAIRNYIEFDHPDWSNAMAALKEGE